MSWRCLRTSCLSVQNSFWRTSYKPQRDGRIRHGTCQNWPHSSPIRHPKARVRHPQGASYVFEAARSMRVQSGGSTGTARSKSGSVSMLGGPLGVFRWTIKEQLLGPRWGGAHPVYVVFFLCVLVMNQDRHLQMRWINTTRARQRSGRGEAPRTDTWLQHVDKKFARRALDSFGARWRLKGLGLPASSPCLSQD